MLTLPEIETIEARIAQAGKTIADLCREAGIAQTTWGRWKRGEFFPSYRTAQKVKDAVERLDPPATKGDAA